MAIVNLCQNKKKMEKINPKTAEVLKFVKVAGAIAAIFLFPKAMSTLVKEGIIEKLIFPEENSEDQTKKTVKDLKISRLRTLIKRLKKQNDVQLLRENGKLILKLTEKGKIKLLKYDLKNLKLKKPKKWDGKWRLIVYDVPEKKYLVRDVFRRYLKSMEFLKLQASVYLTPYPCETEIELLRNYYDIINEVVVLTVSGIEQEQAYQEYFKIE